MQMAGRECHFTAMPIQNNLSQNCKPIYLTLFIQLCLAVAMLRRRSPNISPVAFLVDRCENVYVSGWGGSPFPAPSADAFGQLGVAGYAHYARAH